MAEFRVGVVGLGGRGMGHLHGILTERDDTVVTAVCDTYEDRCAKAAKVCKDKKNWDVAVTTDYRALIERDDVDVVCIFSAWENHIPAAIYAMNCGKQVCTEVGGAYSLEDCWSLVETYERTRIHCMMLENCCYDRNEMMVMRTARAAISTICGRRSPSARKTAITACATIRTATARTIRPTSSVPSRRSSTSTAATGCSPSPRWPPALSV